MIQWVTAQPLVVVVQSMIHFVTVLFAISSSHSSFITPHRVHLTLFPTFSDALFLAALSASQRLAETWIVTSVAFIRLIPLQTPFQDPRRHLQGPRTQLTPTS